MAYGLDRVPTTEELEEMAESWRPYRTWVSLHLRAMLEEETGDLWWRQEAGYGVGSRSLTAGCL